MSTDTVCESGGSDDHITEFEHHHHIRMPEDFRDYLLVMNGTAGDYGFGVIRFWGLDEIKSIEYETTNASQTAAVIQRTYKEPIEDATNYFVFADCMHEAQLYAIRLLPSQVDSGEIIMLDGANPRKVADSFAHFVELYLTTPEKLCLVVD